MKFADYARKAQGVTLDPNAIFDVQVKRLHEYKRQLLNVLHIITLYQQLQDDPNCITRPHTFLFGAKAAPGYAVAKRIIHLINSLADDISHDPRCRGKLQVVFLENYRVSLAEHLMPASEVSQQISTAGKEASGTGNMKFMMNGAVTIGTMDGANVEIYDQVGAENIYIFGMRADTVAALESAGGYNPMTVFENNAEIRRALTQMIDGTLMTENPAALQALYHDMLFDDRYFVLKDFGSYSMAQRRVNDDYQDRDKWLRMAVINTAKSGIFSSDRTIREYNEKIWHLK